MGKDRKAYKKEYIANYRRTFMGRLKIIYNNMKSRTRIFNFGDIISKEEFEDFALQDFNYINIFEIWVKSNYKHDFVPSIDRIDCNKGYIIDNIQFLTLADNASKARKEYPNSNKSRQRRVVLVSSIDGSKLYFDSEVEASKFLNLSKNMVGTAIRHNGGKVKEFIPYFIDNENNIILSKRQQEKIDNPPNLYNKKKIKITREGEERIFNSEREALSFMGLRRRSISKQGILKGCKFGSRKDPKGGWTVLYLNEELMKEIPMPENQESIERQRLKSKEYYNNHKGDIEYMQKRKETIKKWTENNQDKVKIIQKRHADKKRNQKEVINNV